MAKASEQFRQSDVTIWGIVALVCGALAVLGANVSAIVPGSVLGNLHKTRIEGASLDQLRVQVASLREQSLELQRDNRELANRFALEQQQGNAVRQRVGALEVSLPNLLEAMPEGARIDRTAQTASIGDAQVYEAEGGSVMVRQRPMAEAAADSGTTQPLPDPVEPAGAVLPNTLEFGIALGSAVPAEEAPQAWTDLAVKLGPLLFGMSPLLVDEAEGGDKRIVAGPIPQLAEATALCSRLERISIACLPMPFTGTPLGD